MNGIAEDGNRESKVGTCCVGGRTECDLLSLFPLTADRLKLIQTSTLQADSHTAGWHHSRHDLCPYQVPHFIKHSLGVWTPCVWSDLAISSKGDMQFMQQGFLLVFHKTVRFRYKIGLVSFFLTLILL